MKQMKLKTSVGTLYLVASEAGLCGVFWEKQKAPMGESKLLAQAAREIEEYLAGRRRIFNVPLDAEATGGTPFQRKVWAELARIPYGSTISYRELAARVKNRNAVRAVGAANSRNPLCIVVPCHRVIASSGKLQGYSGGLPAKTKLLELERGPAKR